MARSLLYRLFGLGRIPAATASALEAEGVLYFEEGLRSSVTFRGYRSPRRACSYKKQLVTCSVALTADRLIVFLYGSPMIDVPLADPRRGAIEINSLPKGGLSFHWQAEDLTDEASGEVTLKVGCERPKDFLSTLEEAT